MSVALSVTDFGCAPDGRDCSAPLAAAMAACAAQRGCTLTFPYLPPLVGGETVYRTSSWALAASNLTLVVPAGVTVRGTETDAANLAPGAPWPTLPWVEHPAMPCNDCAYACGAGCGPVKRGWLYAQNVSGVVIEGGGTLHGGGRYWWCARDPAQTHHVHPPAVCEPRNSTNMLHATCPPRMVHLVGVSDVVLRNLTFTHSPYWTMHFQFCDGVLLDGVKVFNPNNASYYVANGDGLDVSHSRNVIVRNSVFDVADDHAIVRAGFGYAAVRQGEGRCGARNILFEDSEMRNGFGVGVGSDGVGGVANVTFQRLFFNGNGPQGGNGTAQHGHSSAKTNVARIFVKAQHGGVWSNLTWQDIRGVNVVGGIGINEAHSSAHNDPPWPLPPPLPLGKGPGPTGHPRFENLLFSNFNLTVGANSPPDFATIPGTIQNLTLRRISLRSTAALRALRGAAPRWSCDTVDCHHGFGSSCDPPTAPTGPIEHNRFYCDGCTAEDVSPPLHRDGSYDCRFTGPPTPAPPLPSSCNATLRNGTECHGDQIGAAATGGELARCCETCESTEGCGAFTFATTTSSAAVAADVDCWLHGPGQCALRVASDRVAGVLHSPSLMVLMSAKTSRSY